jgi:signal transduction histidine kinase
MKRTTVKLVAAATVSAFIHIQPAFAERTMTLGEYSREARFVLENRIRTALSATNSTGTVAGTVTFSGDDSFYIQQDDDGFKIVVDDSATDGLPAAGDVVEVEGSPSLEGGRVVFAAKKWKKVDTDGLPEARSADEEDLVFAGDEKSGVNWLRVEVSGRAIGLTSRGFAMDVGGVPVNVFVSKLPDFLSDCDSTHPKVKVRGVAELMLDQSTLFTDSRYVMGVKINVSDSADIALMPDLSYLAAKRDRRVMFAAGAFVALLALGLVIFAVVIFRQRRRNFRANTVMAERKRMADDLHDTIEQHLAGAMMLVRLGKSKEAQDVLAHAKREMRDIVWGLMNDDMMRLSPTEMLREMAKNENRKGIYRVDTKLEGLPASMDASSMRDLSLIVREAIGNAVKHGGAKKIAIAGEPTSTGWRLRVANDGAAFDPAAAPGPAEGHFGVEGMRQRARRIGAGVSFSVRNGWTVLDLEVKNDKSRSH